MAYSMMQLKRYLDSKEWKYTKNGENALTLRLKLNSVESCLLHITVYSANTITFQTIFPVKVPEERRAAVNEYLCLANNHLVCGNFQMRYEDGEIRYRLGQFADTEEEIALEYLGRLVNIGCYIIDSYAPGMLKVLYGNEEPKAALEFTEAVIKKNQVKKPPEA